MNHAVQLIGEAGGELEQIQFLLGRVSVQTTKRSHGCKQRFRDAVNAHFASREGILAAPAIEGFQELGLALEKARKW